MNTYSQRVSVYQFDADRSFEYLVVFNYLPASYWEPEDIEIKSVIDENGDEIDETHRHYQEACAEVSYIGAEAYDEY